MDYKEKIIALLNDKELSQEQKEKLEEVFPELVESEDERIRKAILNYFTKCWGNCKDDICGIHVEDVIAWLEKQSESKSYSWKPTKEQYEALDYAYNSCSDTERGNYYEGVLETLIEDLHRLEKQGEQKSFDYENANIQQKDFAPKVELKFKKGDWIISNNKQSTYQVIEVKRGIYVIRDNADNHEFYIGIEECEKSGRLFTIQDAKDGDVLYSPCLELLWIFKNRDSVYCGCNLSYNNGAFCGEGYFEMPTDAIPATKEQRDTLERAMNDAGWEFDFDKKELKKISQRMVSAEAKEAMYDKPTDEEMKELLRTEYEKGRADAIAEMQVAWSEEDERNLRLTEYAVMKFFGGDCSLVGWLRKSLRPQSHWKPSDEQMECLLSEVTAWTKGCPKQKVLESLYNDLKKLKA